MGTFRITRCVTLMGALVGATAMLDSSLVFARDMQGRLGLGYNNQWGDVTTARVPGVSLKYGLTRDIAGELIVSVATTSPASNVTAVKFFKNVFYENNLNFYFLLGVGLVTATKTGAEFLAGFGAEFFIPGLESLGFSIETGGAFDNLSGSFALKTMGFSFLDAGIHFYF